MANLIAFHAPDFYKWRSTCVPVCCATSGTPLEAHTVDYGEGIHPGRLSKISHLRHRPKQIVSQAGCLLLSKGRLQTSSVNSLSLIYSLGCRGEPDTLYRREHGIERRLWKAEPWKASRIPPAARFKSSEARLASPLHASTKTIWQSECIRFASSNPNALGMLRVFTEGRQASSYQLCQSTLGCWGRSQLAQKRQLFVCAGQAVQAPLDSRGKLGNTNARRVVVASNLL
jgi:hypothetical protein